MKEITDNELKNISGGVAETDYAGWNYCVSYSDSTGLRGGASSSAVIFETEGEAMTAGLAVYNQIKAAFPQYEVKIEVFRVIKDNPDFPDIPF